MPSGVAKLVSFAGRRTRTALASAGLAALASGVLAARVQIVRIAPVTAALFDALGLRVNLVGLEIIQASARIVADGERRILVVDGQVSNPTSATRPVPPMQVAIRDQQGQQVYAWATKASSHSIAPGELATFSARLAAPPSDGADVVIEFGTAAPASGVRKGRG